MCISKKAVRKKENKWCKCFFSGLTSFRVTSFYKQKNQSTHQSFKDLLLVVFLQCTSHQCYSVFLFLFAPQFEAKRCIKEGL